jgi:hypothetical protein
VNHPQIKTVDLSDDTIKALMETLMDRFYAEQNNPGNGAYKADAILKEYRKLERFLDR